MALPERRPPWSIGVAAVALFVVAVGYRFRIGLDGVAYVSIAEHWAAGDVGAAVNPYWGPLLSWLVAPLLVVGVDAVLAGIVVTAASGVLVAVAVRRTASTLGASEHASDLAVVVAVPFLLAAMSLGVFADLLLVGLVVMTLVEVQHLFDEPTRRRAVRAGGWAAAASLAKFVAVPVIAVGVVALLLLRHEPLGRRLRQAALPVVTFAAVPALVLGAWVAALSVDAGEPTVPSQIQHNLQLAAPGSTGSAIFQPGLLVPDEPAARSAWEDPSATPVVADGWLESGRESLARLRDNVRRGMHRALDLATERFAAPLVVGALGIVASRRGWRPHPLAGALVVASAVSVVGHATVTVETRYLWLPVVAGLAVAGPTLDRLRRPERPLVAAAVGLLVLLPLWDDMTERWNEGAKTDRLAHRADSVLPPGAVVASDGGWQASAVVCLVADCRYVGVPAGDAAAALAELRAADVTHFLVWSPDGEAPLPALAPAGVDEPELVVYELEDDA